MTIQPTDPMSGVAIPERRTRTVARWPERRAHDFWSPWPTAARTRCEHCGKYWKAAPEQGQPEDHR